MLKKITLILLVIFSFQISFAQSSFEPLEYKSQSIKIVSEADELSSCDDAKAYVESYFERVSSFHKELQGALVLQTMSLLAWSEEVAQRADKKIYYKKDSFKALNSLNNDLSQYSAALDQNSYVLSEDGFLILDNVIPECFPDASDEFYEGYEAVVTKRLNLADIYNKYLKSLGEKISVLYESVSILEAKKEYFGEDNLLKFNELADTENGFIYGVNLYDEIIESYVLQEEKLLEEL